MSLKMSVQQSVQRRLTLSLYLLVSPLSQLLPSPHQRRRVRTSHNVMRTAASYVARLILYRRRSLLDQLNLQVNLLVPLHVPLHASLYQPRQLNLQRLLPGLPDRDSVEASSFQA